MRRRVSRRSSRRRRWWTAAPSKTRATAEQWVKARAAQRWRAAGTGGRPGARGAGGHRHRTAARRAGTRRAVRAGPDGDHRRRRRSRGVAGAGGAGRLRHRQGHRAERRPEALRQLRAATEAGGVAVHDSGAGARWRRRSCRGLAAGRRPSSALLRTDLALKSSAGEATALLERLVVELCAPRGTRPAAGRPGRGSGEIPRRA